MLQKNGPACHHAFDGSTLLQTNSSVGSDRHSSSINITCFYILNINGIFY